jgi:hypothetical protein
MRIALLPPGSEYTSAARYVFDELYGMFIDSGYNMFDRASINIAIENEFDFPGYYIDHYIDDDTAIRIGNLLGTQIIIFGYMPDFGTDKQDLVYHILEVETGREIGFSTTIVPSYTPDWIDELPFEDTIWGIGSAKLNSPAMSMTVAETRARVSIARQLVEIARNTLLGYNIDPNIQGFSVVTITENISREIINIDLSGARAIRRWQGPDGTFWYLVEYKKALASETISGIFNNIEKETPQFKASNALLVFNSNLAKIEKPLVVSD